MRRISRQRLHNFCAFLFHWCMFMRKIIVYIAMSLDGYIADTSGGVAWLLGDGSDPENMGSYPAFIQTVDTVILGYTTYQQIITELAPHQWPYEGKHTYVFTHKARQNTEKITFIDSPIPDFLKSFKHLEGEHIWLCGGASLINQCISCDIVDEFVISIIPTLLGGGVRLFEKYSSQRLLKLISTNSANGIVDLTYVPRHISLSKKSDLQVVHTL